MIIYYIDDSFFQQSAFSKTMYIRLQEHLKKDPPSLILISVLGKESEQLSKFIEKMSTQFTILTSPCKVRLDDAVCDLYADRLILEESAVCHCASGSFYRINTENKLAQRYYLDFFMHHENDAMMDLADQIEDILRKKFGLKKHIYH